jgi:hypothetical protein
MKKRKNMERARVFCRIIVKRLYLPTITYTHLYHFSQMKKMVGRNKLSKNKNQQYSKFGDNHNPVIDTSTQ